MEADAYKLGHLDAVLALGVTKEAYNQALLPILGALGGAALARDDERTQGALLGGLGTFGLQSALAGHGQHVPAGAPAAVTAAVKPKITFNEVFEHSKAEAGDRLNRWLNTVAPPRPKLARLDSHKIALDFGGSVPLPGLGGFGVSFKDQRERLPGMSRWVPRGTLERGFDYADEGFDPETVMDMEAERGSLTHPLAGAAVGALGALKLAPKSGLGGVLLGGLGGAGLGQIYHSATKDTRAREGLEALEGAQKERSTFPIRRHAVQTANEPMPMAVSRGHGDA